MEYIEEKDLQRIFKHIKDYPDIIIREFFSLIFGIAGRPKKVMNGLVEGVEI